MHNIRNDYTFDYFSKFLKYDETSPSGLTWIVDRTPKRTKGLPAGHIAKVRNNPYYVVTVEDFGYFAHRIIMVLHGFNMPITEQVDHIDGDGTNNNIGNLRVVSARENSWNRGKRKQNLSGTNGVSVEADKMYRAYWYGKDGKRRSKAFSFNKYGVELALKLATDWRLRQLELNGILLTERHGEII